MYASRLPNSRSNFRKPDIRLEGICVDWVCCCRLLVFLSSPLLAQISTGSLAGTVTDRGAGVLTKAAITVTNKATGAARTTQTGNDGAFSVPSLQAGEYDVLIASDGFQPTVTTVVVATGATTSVRIQLEVSSRTEAITVTGVSPLVDLESNKVQGLVGRQQIENLPLNGRSFLNLAALQPGVTVSIGNPAQFNAQFNVSVLGAPASRTAITVDGGNVRNPVEGGTGQNFSQEVVQEFQISTANFDLSTGIAAFGAINVVTRSGTNEFTRRRVRLLPRPQHGGVSQPGPQLAHRRSGLLTRAGWTRARRTDPEGQGSLLRELRVHRSKRRLRRPARPQIRRGIRNPGEGALSRDTS